MSEFRGLPQNFGGSQDDEFLLVTPERATRATLKSLFWDNYALLKFRWPADQGYGIGTANQWVRIPYNTLELDATEAWIQLNADGSFTLDAGRYLFAASQEIRQVDFCRFAIYQGTTIITATTGFAWTSDSTSSIVDLKKKLSLGVQETFSLQINVSNASAFALQRPDTFLAGTQADTSVCEIIKLG